MFPNDEERSIYWDRVTDGLRQIEEIDFFVEKKFVNVDQGTTDLGSTRWNFMASLRSLWFLSRLFSKRYSNLSENGWVLRVNEQSDLWSALSGKVDLEDFFERPLLPRLRKNSFAFVEDCRIGGFIELLRRKSWKEERASLAEMVESIQIFLSSRYLVKSFEDCSNKKVEVLLDECVLELVKKYEGISLQEMLTSSNSSLRVLGKFIQEKANVQGI